MSDSENDDELRRAMALSLQELSPSPTTKSSIVIDLVSDDSDVDEDDNLDAPQRVISDNKRPRTENAKVIPDASNRAYGGELEETAAKPGNLFTSSSALNTSLQKPAAQSGFSLLGIDRKAMEAERRARAAQKKENQDRKPEINSRKRNVSPSLSSAGPSLPEAKKVRPSHINDQIGRNPPPARLSTMANSPIQYPKGVVKRTSVSGFPRQSDDITIEEVFRKENLDYAVLSAFQIDPAWVQTKLDPRTRVIWVLQAKNNTEKQRWQIGADKDYRFCFPSMEGNINCMHSKLQLLVYPSHLRIAVPSGNLTSYDWGETGVVENVCFLIDLPRLATGQELNHDQTQFGREFIRFVNAMGLDQKLVRSLGKFDFTQTEHLGFVHTIGGSHTGDALQHTGYCGLATCVRELGLHTNDNLELDFLSGSVGSISYQFINSLALAAQGLDGLIGNYLPADKSSKTKGSEKDEQLLIDLQSRCRVYFPTHETVANCRGGINVGGTICLESKWYNSTNFPRLLMRDCESTRKGLLIHSKIWFVRPKKMNIESPAWAYVGSANLSESAWGRLVKDKITKKSKLNCRNWECGVIFPTPAKNADELPKVFGMEVFQGHVPVPMVTPGKPYNGARPWFYKEQ